MSLLETEEKIGKSESMMNKILKFVFRDGSTCVRKTF